MKLTKKVGPQQEVFILRNSRRSLLNVDLIILQSVIKTDISITSPKRKIIIDTKYYRECLQEHYDKKIIVSSNLYQLLAYLENADAQTGNAHNCEGMLIYPTVKNELDLHYTIEDHKISIKTINLNQDWRKISEDLISFIN